MTRETTRLMEWLRSADLSSAGCPPPEAYLRAVTAELTADERSRLNKHATQCPACTAERMLAGVFDASGDEIDSRKEDLAYVVSRLEDTPLGGARKTRHRPPAAWYLAAAAMLVVGIVATLMITRSPGPQVRPLTRDVITRGTRLSVIRPAGELDTFPRVFQWEARTEAKSYRLRLSAVDGATLWETSVVEPTAALPQDVLDILRRTVVYRWRVEALDGQGRLLAASEPIEILVRAEAGD